MKLAIALCATVLLSGCGTSFFSDRKTNPVIDESVGGTALLQSKGVLGALATKAEYRTVNVVLDEDTFFGFCPEPPPDVAQQLQSNFSSKIDAAIKAKGVDAKLASEITDAVQTEIFKLTERTPALQYNRDSLYYLCVAKLNGHLTDEQYSIHLADIRGKSYKLMDK